MRTALIWLIVVMGACSSVVGSQPPPTVAWTQVSSSRSGLLEVLMPYSAFITTTLEATGLGTSAATGCPQAAAGNLFEFKSGVLNSTLLATLYWTFWARSHGPMLNSTDEAVKFRAVPVCVIVTTPKTSGGLTAVAVELAQALLGVLGAWMPTMRSPG